ncbi:hypothetical protein FHW79_005374 [Azospirillum sp. OGB3]|uniref:hypothetical protein n=1 Tax=Azospirillum sp. OGB3 TaxID=2587012 RepID=UPI001606450F|nr:hypothetical protein [Azospirillum sp. OGB3]MBB3267709.1 hypothetical protein [Azospirillum sp. OGB3]
MPDILQLQEYVAAFRARLDAGRDQLPQDACSNFPTGCCGTVSEVLAEALRRDLGVAAAYVCGRRYDDNGTSTHAWIEAGDIIIDVTADQFGQPAVIVTRDRSWHDTWPNQEHRAYIDPNTDPAWWARYGTRVLTVGTGK